MRKTRLRKLLVPVLAAFAAVGCSDDDDPMGPSGGPPNISGDYLLVSFTQGDVTITPPVAQGSLLLDETSRTDTEATGDIDLGITVPDGMGGTTNIAGTGTYTINVDGSWTQDLTSLQATGTVTLVGNTLTVEVTDPPTAVSTSVWQRQ